MKLLTDLFTTDYGLMSITGIVLMLGMGVFFICLFRRKMDEDARAAGLVKQGVRAGPVGRLAWQGKMGIFPDPPRDRDHVPRFAPSPRGARRNIDHLVH